MNNKQRAFNFQLSTCNLLTYLLVFFVLFTSFCGVRTKPDKVWDIRGKIVTLSKSLTGLPYRYGGDDIDGFDCSGLVRYVYGCFGFEVPRTAKKQGKLKNKVTLKKAKPGDIVVFKLKRKRWHSGIIIGKEYFVHAPNRREPVREEFFNSYWRSHLAAVIRIIDE